MDKPAGYAAYTKYFEKRDTRALLDQAKAVEGLLSHPGWEVLDALVREHCDRLLRRLVHGAVLTQAEYAAQTGIVSGLEQALHAAQGVLYAAQVREREERAAAERAARGDRGTR